MNDVERWTCGTCHKAVATPYCPDCGDSAVRSDDLTFRHLLLHAFNTISDLDGRLWLSFRRLLFTPGSLTVAYMQGPRKPYMSPIELFLIVNLVFFTVQSLISEKIFSTPLASHLHGQDWSPLARSLVAHRLAAKNMTLEAYAPVFDTAVATNAKSLVILMVVPFIAMLTLLFWRSARPFMTGVVFALHFYAVQLLLLSVLLIVQLADTRHDGAGLASPGMDTALFAAQLTVSALYLYPAAARVYGTGGIGRALKVGALVAAVGATILGYRFAVFLITLYTT